MLFLLATSALAQDLDFGITPSPGPKENPAFFLTPTRDVKTLFVDCNAGGKQVKLEKTSIKAMNKVTITLPRNERVTTASCFVRAGFVDGDVVEMDVPLEWQYSVALSVDLGKASADLEAKTVTVSATARVDEAEIIAYGAGKEIIDKRVVSRRARERHRRRVARPTSCCSMSRSRAAAPGAVLPTRPGSSTSRTTMCSSPATAT